MARKRRSVFARFLYFIIVLFLLAGIFGMGMIVYWISTLKIPDFSSFENRKIIQSTKIYDRTGEILLWDIHKDIKRTVVPFENISRHIKNATVAIEDSEFYQHKGIDIPAIFRALFIDIKTGSIKQGASTITQQLAKNALLTFERSFARKIKEVVLAFKLEKDLSKEEILALYLNEIPYGGSLYGIEAASQAFFGKKSEDLILAESVYLAALPQAPTYYSPYGNNMNKLEDRKNLVLSRMKELGFITEEEEKQAKEEEVNFLARDSQSIKAPHFTIFIRAELEEKYGKDAIEQDGLKVITTLDYELQQKAEKMVAEYVEKTKEKFNANNAGLVAIDPKTGQILVMVGSKDYFNMEEEGNFNVTLAHRQPGSAIKPFIYATVFKKGFTPETVVFDLETEFNVLCNPDGTPKQEVDPDNCYMPRNATGVFKGPITFREGLAQSLNVPSVKVLYLAGIKESINTANDLGITTLEDPNRYGLTLVLGGGEVSLIEMTGAYSVFANEGTLNPYTGILKIEDAKGDVLEEFSDKSKKVLDENISRLINNILSDNEARAPMFGARSPLYFEDYDVAVKTGTTNDFRDAWVVGYTPNFALGVWVGNNDNTPMEYKTASFIAAPLWNAFMKEVLPTRPKEEFTGPEPQYPDQKLKPFLRGEWQGGESYKIDKISGKLATEYTPEELIEEKILTQIHSLLYWIDKDNPLGPKPKNPEDNFQFSLWEKPVRDWAKNQNIKEQTMEDIPQEFDDVHKPEYAPEITIESPTKDATYNPRNVMNIRFSYKSKFGLEQVDFFLGNTYLGSSKKEPFDFSFVPSSVEGTTNSANIKLIAYDKVRNKTEVNIPISFQF